MKKLLLFVFGLFFGLNIFFANPAFATVGEACCAAGSTYKSRGACEVVSGMQVKTSEWTCKTNEYCDTVTNLCALQTTNLNGCQPTEKVLYVCDRNGSTGVPRGCCPPGDNITNVCATACPSMANSPRGEPKIRPLSACRPAGGYLYRKDGNTCKALENSSNIPCVDGLFCNTALGIIETTPSGVLQVVLRYVTMFAGLIILIGIIMAGYNIVTSSGNPEKLQAGKEMLTSAIAGLAMTVLGFVLLRVIGVDILGLPGLTIN